LNFSCAFVLRVYGEKRKGGEKDAINGNTEKGIHMSETEVKEKTACVEEKGGRGGWGGGKKGVFTKQLFLVRRRKGRTQIKKKLKIESPSERRICLVVKGGKTSTHIHLDSERGKRCVCHCLAHLLEEWRT